MRQNDSRCKSDYGLRVSQVYDPSQFIITIISEHDVLKDTLAEVLDDSVFITNIYPSDKARFATIDVCGLLIVDNVDLAGADIPVYRIRNILNLGRISTSFPGIINMDKPLRLTDLVDLIVRLSSNKDIFVYLGDMIYSEGERELKGPESSIRLTEKENKIISFVLRQEGSKASKEDLFRAVWNYSANAETSTLDTHLYKLRQKLPEGVLQIQGEICQLRGCL